MAMPILLALSTLPLRFIQFGRPDLNNPRLQAKQFRGLGQRLDSAQKNAWEGLMLLCATMVLANLANLELDTLIYPVFFFVAARILHAVFYALNLGALRFLSFVASTAAIVWIIAQAFKAL